MNEDLGAQHGAWSIVMEAVTHMVAMRDGVRLATDVHLPDGAGPFPVILERTPYGRAETSRSEITAAEPHARIARPNSPPISPRTAMPSSTRTAAAATARKGASSNTCPTARTGSTPAPGCATAVVRRPHLHHGPVLRRAHAGRAGLPRSAGPGGAGAGLRRLLNAWRSGIRQSGAFELKQATWAFKNALVSPEAQADPVMRAALEAEDIRDWFTRMPWKPGHSPLRHHPDYEAYLFEQWTHGAFDEFWQQLGI